MGLVVCKLGDKLDHLVSSVVLFGYKTCIHKNLESTVAKHGYDASYDQITGPPAILLAAN